MKKLARKDAAIVLACVGYVKTGLDKNSAQVYNNCNAQGKPMKKSTRIIILSSLGLLILCGLLFSVSVLYMIRGGAFLTAASATKSLSTSPLVGNWLCDDCAGRKGVSILRAYLADGTWTGHVTDSNGNTYDYHGNYSLLSNTQYSEIDFSDSQNSTPQPGIYNFTINGDTLTLSLADGDTLIAEFHRAK